MRSFFFFLFYFSAADRRRRDWEEDSKEEETEREREILSHSSYEIGTRERASGCIQAFRRKRELTGERGNEVSFKMVRARALRGRLWMRINLDSAQDLFNLAATPKRRNNDGRTSSSLLRPGSFPPPLSLPLLRWFISRSRLLKLRPDRPL